MKYRTMMFNDSLFISLSQFVAILEKPLKVSFYKERQSEMLDSYFYQRHTPITKKLDICLWVFNNLNKLQKFNPLLLLVNCFKVFSSSLFLVFSLEQLFYRTSQPAFTCSKLTIEILEQGVKYVQS